MITTNEINEVADRLMPDTINSLVIAVAVICVWIYRDATNHGRNLARLIAAGIVGMFSPLDYILTRNDSERH